MRLIAILNHTCFVVFELLKSAFLFLEPYELPLQDCNFVLFLSRERVGSEYHRAAQLINLPLQLSDIVLLAFQLLLLLLQLGWHYLLFLNCCRSFLLDYLVHLSCQLDYLRSQLLVLLHQALTSVDMGGFTATVTCHCYIKYTRL